MRLPTVLMAANCPPMGFALPGPAATQVIPLARASSKQRSSGLNGVYGAQLSCAGIGAFVYVVAFESERILAKPEMGVTVDQTGVNGGVGAVKLCRVNYLAVARNVRFAWPIAVILPPEYCEVSAPLCFLPPVTWNRLRCFYDSCSFHALS